jgi:hypothetical protein
MTVILSVVTIIALFAGPALAVWYGNRIQKTNERLRLFSTLMATRADLLSMDRMRALALIDLVFYKDDAVRTKWREWHEAITNSSLNDQRGWEIRNLKYNDLLTEMARAVGFERITANEIQRSYSPEAFRTNTQLQSAQAIEFYRVLKNSQNFGTPRSDNPTKFPWGEPEIF